LHLILLSTFEVFHHHQFAVLSLLSGKGRSIEIQPKYGGSGRPLGFAFISIIAILQAAHRCVRVLNRIKLLLKNGRERLQLGFTLEVVVRSLQHTSRVCLPSVNLSLVATSFYLIPGWGRQRLPNAL